MKIVQLSDVHIRPFKRLEEYKKVFSILYEQLRKLKPDIIINCGDNFDAKLNLSPESVTLAYEFFGTLSEIAPYYIITGNHDLNLNNLNRLDSISAIANVLKQNKNFHYLQHSGLYDIHPELTLGVFSLLGTKENWPLEPKKVPDKKYIALYHGPVDGCKNTEGYKIEGDVNTSIFKNYDVTLLGDIHLRQFLNDEKTIAYPGSLIQQNFGEDEKKGYLVWDTESMDAKFVEIPNEYSFQTIKINSVDEIDAYYDKQYLPTARVRIIVNDTLSTAQETTIKNKFLEKFEFKDTPLITSGVGAIENYKTDNKEMWLNYSNIEFQKELLTKWLKENGFEGESFLKECVEIHKRCIAKINITEYQNNEWELLNMEFSYFGKYGKENKIDFSKLKGLVGLFAKNRSGKTSLIETLTYLITGSTIKNINLDKFVNLRQPKATGLIEIKSADGIHYKIERTLTKKKTGDGTSSKIKVGKLVDNNWIDLNEEDAVKTNKLCKELFGSKEDFLLTSISAQENFAGLIDATDSKRLETLYKFTNLDFFEALKKEAKNEIDTIQSEINILQKNSNSDTYQLLQNQEKGTEIKISELEQQLEEQKNNITIVTDEIITAKSLLKPVKNELNIEEVRSTLDNSKRIVTSTSQSIDNFTGSKKTKTIALQKKGEELKKILGGTKLSEIVKHLEPVKTMEDDRTNVMSNVKLLEQKKNQIDNKLTILKAQPWVNDDPNCRKCMFLKDAWQAQDDSVTLLEQLTTLKDNANNLNEKLKEVGYSYREIISIREIANEYSSIKSSIEKIDLEIENNKQQKEKYETLVTQQQDIINEHFSLLQELEEYNKAKQHVDTLELKKKRLENSYLDIEKNIWNARKELASIQGKIENLTERLQRVLELEVQTKFYNAYMKATSRNGIPYQIIQHILPSINIESNRILSETQNWKIQLSADNNKMDINIMDISNGEEDALRPIESASGAERTITSLALRSAFNKISFLPRPKFMLIDESFGALDESNLSKVGDFLNQIKENFSFILVISHIPQIQELIDTELEITTNENNESKIWWA